MACRWQAVLQHRRQAASQNEGVRERRFSARQAGRKGVMLHPEVKAEAPVALPRHATRPPRKTTAAEQDREQGV